MLKNLFTKLKSEKTSTLKDEEPIEKTEFVSNYQANKSFPMSAKVWLQLGQKLIDQSSHEQFIVKGEIKQVRYWTNEQIPNIFTQVLSCPISHYNMLPHSQRKVKQIDLKKDKFPEYLNFMKPLLQKQLPTYNHLLINHYPRGIGIMPHLDGPMYKDKVVVLSLGGPALISFQENYKKQSKNMQILLQDKSIHIFEYDAYQKYLHGIQNNKVDAITFSIHCGKNQSVGMEDAVISLPRGQSCQIGECSIKNLCNSDSICKVIEKHLSRLTFKGKISEQERYCFDFDQFQGYQKIKGAFIFICPEQLEQSKPNTEVPQKENRFRWKMEIQRQQRISITIRQQYSSQSL